MAKNIDIKVPDIGDFENVEIIDVLVKAGDKVEAESPLITLETDKAAMDVPAPQAGTITSLKVGTGDKVSEGDVIAVLEADASASNAKDEPADKKASKQADKKAEKPAPKPGSYSGKADVECEVLVLGAGPGGYTAAFRAADLGKQVVMVERWSSLGGVCLNVGCIPSKALLHAAKVMDEAAHMSDYGIEFGKPKIKLPKLAEWKNSVVGKLTGGLASMAKQRKVSVVNGYGRFLDAHHVEVEGLVDGKDDKKIVRFEQAIIAAGSEPVKLPFAPEDERIMDSTGALELKDIPGKLLVIGGGIIGLEMACVYEALGSEVTVVELADGIMPGADKDLVRPLLKRIKDRYAAIMTGTKVTAMKAQKNGIKVSFDGKNAPDGDQIFDRVLVAVGRVPNGGKVDADKAGVNVSDRGFIDVDKQMRTNVDHIFAIGDLVGQPMLAHKATHEAKVAAEVAAGEKSFFDARVIPSVAYTDPEVAWVGVTEEQAKADGLDIETGKFPWAASGRSLAQGRDDGFTKLVFDRKTDRVIGGATVGPNAGELIAEICLAIEMGCDAADIGLTIHPHPTLSESVGLSAEAFEGTITDLYIPKRKK
ncbi:MAG: dihydrolipoyl dehydrogenase [Gammaproteobacteria bacterium]|nr:dihydrolipoyl dehydrogenase [Gammaproteobacteria bacterium]